MAARRGWGSDGIYFDHAGPCTTRPGTGTAPAAGAGSSASGPARRQADPPQGVRHDQGRRRRAARAAAPRFGRGRTARARHHTVRQAAEDWLAQGLPGRSAKTIRKNKDVPGPILAAIGTRRLKELTSTDVDAALGHMAASYSTAAVAMGHLALKRVRSPSPSPAPGSGPTPTP
jgi:hypothetical protein